MHRTWRRSCNCPGFGVQCMHRPSRRPADRVRARRGAGICRVPSTGAVIPLCCGGGQHRHARTGLAACHPQPRQVQQRTRHTGARRAGLVAPAAGPARRRVCAHLRAAAGARSVTTTMHASSVTAAELVERIRSATPMFIVPPIVVTCDSAPRRCQPTRGRDALEGRMHQFVRHLSDAVVLGQGRLVCTHSARDTSTPRADALLSYLSVTLKFTPLRSIISAPPPCPRMCDQTARHTPFDASSSSGAGESMTHAIASDARQAVLGAGRAAAVHRSRRGSVLRAGHAAGGAVAAADLPAAIAHASITQPITSPRMHAWINSVARGCHPRPAAAGAGSTSWRRGRVWQGTWLRRTPTRE